MWCEWLVVGRVSGETHRWVVYTALGAVSATGAVDAGVAGGWVYVCTCKQQKQTNVYLSHRLPMSRTQN